jgi:hypothetical protein
MSLHTSKIPVSLIAHFQMDLPLGCAKETIVPLIVPQKQCIYLALVLLIPPPLGDTPIPSLERNHPFVEYDTLALCIHPL